MFVNCLCGPAIGRSGGWLFAYQGLGTSDTPPSLMVRTLVLDCSQSENVTHFLACRFACLIRKHGKLHTLVQCNLALGIRFELFDVHWIFQGWMVKPWPSMPSQSRTLNLFELYCHRHAVQNAVTCHCQLLAISRVFFFSGPCWSGLCSFCAGYVEPRHAAVQAIFCFELRSVASMPRFCRWRGTEPFRNAAAWWHKDFDRICRAQWSHEAIWYLEMPYWSHTRLNMGKSILQALLHPPRKWPLVNQPC